MASTPISSARSEDRLLQLLGQQTLRISELEAENNILRTQVAELLPTQRGHAEVPPDNEATKRHADLDRANQQLSAQNARAARHLERMTNKYTMAKERVYEWHDYAQRLKAKFKSKTSTHTSAVEPQPPTSDVATALQSTSPVAAQGSSEKTVVPRTTSSQSTVYEPEAEPELPQYDNDEEPVLVSERRLKRRRLDTNRSPRIKQEGFTSSKPFVIASDESDTPQARRLQPEMSNLNDPIEAEPVNVSTTTPRPRTAEAIKKSSPGSRKPLGDISNNIQSTKKRAFSDIGKKPSIKHKALRSKPLEELQLRDFCPNPYYTGPAMTFYDALKPDTTRTCLPTCTRAACCGNKWRRAIEIGGAQVTGKTNAEVLEDYFGANWKEIYEANPVEKRRDFVNQAHALSLARQSGVHSRHSIRPPTPPGLWRTDMPSTQELQAYKDEAAEQEKCRIAERHHEAMREGGQWLFRDEA